MRSNSTLAEARFSDELLLKLHKENRLSSVSGFFNLKPKCYDEDTTDRDFTVSVYQHSIQFSKSLILHRRDQNNRWAKLNFNMHEIIKVESLAAQGKTLPYLIITAKTKEKEYLQYHFKNPFSKDESQELVDLLNSHIQSETFSLEDEIPGRIVQATLIAFGLIALFAFLR